MNKMYSPENEKKENKTASSKKRLTISLTPEEDINTRRLAENFNPSVKLIYETLFRLNEGNEEYNAVSVPPETDRRRIDVLCADNMKNNSFEKKDVDLLLLLSSHMTVLQKKLKRQIDIPGELIRKVLSGVGLSGVILILAELLKCTVIVEDRRFNIVCRALPENSDSGALKPGEQLKEIKKLKPIADKCREAIFKKKIVYIDPLPEEGIDYCRALAPLFTNEGWLIGYLSVLFRSRNCDEFDILTIEQAALLAAIEFAKEKEFYGIELKSGGDKNF
ncbi:MAG: hypothetical protein FWC60_00310 [Firmicutes bacterium]|nr:hypothetical protein [Bacillota bacterium]